MNEHVLLTVSSLECQVGNGNELFQPISFDICQGEIIYIQGANGSGKTTLLEAIAGLSLTYNGQIHWKKRPILSGDNDDFFFQSRFLGHKLAIKEVLSPLENLKWRLFLKGKVITKSECLFALNQVGLTDYIDQPSHRLSEGQKQKVTLASLLIGHSELWILDEPHVLLDKAGWLWLDQCILNFIKTGGAVIMSSHQGFMEHKPQAKTVCLKPNS